MAAHETKGVKAKGVKARYPKPFNNCELLEKPVACNPA